MKIRILSTVSAIAILASVPAFAAYAQNTEIDSNTNAKAPKTRTLGENIERGWEDTKDAASNAYDGVSEALSDNDGAVVTNATTIDTRLTATGIIGQNAVSTDGKKVAKVEDIILDQNGDPKMIIIADGGVFGLGSKLVAFEYGSIINRTENGDVILPLTEDMIDSAVAFSYDTDTQADEGVQVMASNNFSAKEVLDGNLVNAQNEKVANIDNISFSESDPRLIVAFDQVLGLGGEKAAIDYNDLKLARNDTSIDFQLDANQSAQFESYKKTLAETN